MLVLLFSVVGVLIGILSLSKNDSTINAHIITGNLQFHLENYKVSTKMINSSGQFIVSSEECKTDLTKNNQLKFESMIPGQTNIANLRLTNTGTTAFKVSVILSNETNNEVLFVSFSEDNMSRSINDIILLPNEMVDFQVVIGLKIEAGNQFQNEEIGLNIQVVATQLIE